MLEQDIDDLGLLRLRDVLRLTSLSQATIYRMVQRGEFPRPRRTSRQGAVRWRRSEVREWLEGLEPATLRVPEKR